MLSPDIIKAGCAIDITFNKLHIYCIILLLVVLNAATSMVRIAMHVERKTTRQWKYLQWFLLSPLIVHDPLTFNSGLKTYLFHKSILWQTIFSLSSDSWIGLLSYIDFYFQFLIFFSFWFHVIFGIHTDSKILFFRPLRTCKDQI